MLAYLLEETSFLFVLFSCCDSGLAWLLLFTTIISNFLLQERQQYNPLGWNAKYDWSDADFNTSLVEIKLLLEEFQHDNEWKVGR